MPGDGEADVDSIDDAFDGDDETFDRVEDEESTHSDGKCISPSIVSVLVSVPPSTVTDANNRSNILTLA